MFKKIHFFPGKLICLLVWCCAGSLHAQPTHTASITLCKNAKAFLFARGVVSCTWSVGSNDPYIVVMPSAQANYTVIGKDLAGSLSQTVITVKVITPTPPYVTVTSSSGGTLCAGEYISLTGANGADYVWNNTVGTNTWNTTQITVTPTVNTVYWVTGTNPGSSCVSMDHFRVTVNPCTGLKDFEKKHLSIYPNPASGMFTIQAASDSEVSIVNQLGDVLKTVKLGAWNDHKVNIQDLAEGVYFVIGSAGNFAFVEKILVSDDQ